MTHFQQLAESRRQWINDVLVPWCQVANWQDLRRAELDWTNIAGQVDPKGTLWNWAWQRFPILVHESMAGVNETIEVIVQTRNDETFVGYPDNTRTEGGQLFLVGRNSSDEIESIGPFSIDEIKSVEPTDESIRPEHIELTRPPTVLPPELEIDERV